MTDGTPVALVTGAARRVGRSIASALAQEGFHVWVHYRNSHEVAVELVAEIRSGGGRADFIRADLAAIAEIEGMFGTLAETVGRLDLLVNNASTFHRTRFGDTHEAEFDELIDSNLKGPFFCCQLATPLLEASQQGQIINILDDSDGRPWPEYLPYCAAKAGLRSLTLGLARRLAPKVRVNAVAPGPVLLPETADAVERRALEEATLLGRMGRPRDVARTVVFLATGPTFLTGSVIAVDGGRSLG